MSTNSIEEAPLVILSKSALAPESRNPALQLLNDAGYGQVAELDRRDESTVNGVRFRAMKGPGAVAANMLSGERQPLAFLLGGDVLAEASLIARSYGVRSNIQRVLSLGIGECRLRILAPNEQLVQTPDDLRRRQIFSKYPMLTRSALRSLLGSGGSVVPLEGADTRTCEWRQAGVPVAAYEIVESGRTARANNLQIVEGDFPYPTGEQLSVPFFDPNRITTDLYASNLDRLQGQARDRLLELGLALESARQRNAYAMFQFHVPESRLQEFEKLGMRSPSVQPLLNRPEWRALTVAVPRGQEQSFRRQLMEFGADGIVQFAANAEISSDESEVYRAFAAPTEIASRREAMDVQVLVQRVLSRVDQIRRSPTERPESSTAQSLAKGTRYCADAFAVESIELQEAVSREVEDEAIIEASQCLDWFLVTLQSAQIELQDVLQEFSCLLEVELPTGELQAQLEALVTSLATGRRLNYDTVYDVSRRLSFEAIAFNSKARKSDNPAAKAQAAAGTLLEWLKLLEVAHLRLDDVIAKL